MAAPPAFGEVPDVVHDVLRSPGQPLSGEARADMETRFGYSFADVRVHTDTRAADSAEAVNAIAYTVGSDVVFAAGRYQPHTTEGRALLAHELAHVVQQAGAADPAGDLAIEAPDGPAEHEAEALASAVTTDRPLGAAPGGASLVSRQASQARPTTPVGAGGGGPHDLQTVLAGGLRLAEVERRPEAGLLLQALRYAQRYGDRASLAQEAGDRAVGSRCACGGEVLPGGQCTKCLAARLERQGMPRQQIQRVVRARAELARQQPTPRQRSTVQCINANLANAGIPAWLIAIAGGVCGIIGAVATSPSGPGAAGGAAGAAAVCIAGVTGLSVGVVLGVIIRCIQDPSVEWIFAEAGGAGGGAPAGGGEPGGAAPATAVA